MAWFGSCRKRLRARQNGLRILMIAKGDLRGPQIRAERSQHGPMRRTGEEEEWFQVSTLR